MTHLALFALCLAGFAALALATYRAQQDVLGRELSTAATRRLRAFGWALLIAALWLAVATLGWGLGLVAYSGHTSAGAALVFVALVAWNQCHA